MNKELEEAIKILKRRNKILKLKYAITNEDLNAIEIILNYIDNYISKEVIEEKIKELNNEEKEIYEKYIGNSELYRLSIINEKRNVLQELLEGK